MMTAETSDKNRKQVCAKNISKIYEKTFSHMAMAALMAATTVTLKVLSIRVETTDHSVGLGNATRILHRCI